MIRSARERLATLLRERRLPLLGAAAVVVVLAAALLGWLIVGGDGGDGGDGDDSVVSRPDVREPSAVTLSPAGDEVPRLGPPTINFEEPPASSDTVRLVSFEPAVEGSYTWLDERTLLFQPAFPGLPRGQRYTLTVDSAQAGLEEDFVQSFTVEGRLTVVTVIPADGEVDVPAEAQVLIQFSRSVAPLTLLSEQSDAPVIEFEPPLAGRGEWLNTSLYRFIPTEMAPGRRIGSASAPG